jgi:hypothetical protein
MDPLTLATTVVNLLSPYLSKVAGALADKAANAAGEKLGTLFTAVKAKFTGNVYAEETLKRVKDQPESASRQAALVGVLEEQIKNDPEFAETMRKLVGEAKDSGADNILQNVTISGKARTGNINTIGKIEGNADFSHRK